jgi:glutamate-1-semialdehyde aminotransferase
MATFAKSLSNGYAMGAVVGRRAVMEPASRMFISSTNWSDLVGIVAATATIKEIRRRNIPAMLREYGEQLMAGWNSAAKEIGIAARMFGTPQWPIIEFTPPGDGMPETPGGARSDSIVVGGASLGRKLAALYAQEMAHRRILFNTHPVHSAAHTDRDLDQTLTATRAALITVRDVLHAGRIDESLKATLDPPVFRRLVH